MHYEDYPRLLVIRRVLNASGVSLNDGALVGFTSELAYDVDVYSGGAIIPIDNVKPNQHRPRAGLLTRAAPVGSTGRAFRYNNTWAFDIIEWPDDDPCGTTP
jgi:hypothetical protein